MDTNYIKGVIVIFLSSDFANIRSRLTPGGIILLLTAWHPFSAMAAEVDQVMMPNHNTIIILATGLD